MGHQINVREWKGTVHALLIDFETHFREVLLRGIDLVDLGCDFSPRMHFQDLHSNTQPGYSFLEDPNNPFPSLRHHFAKAVLETGFHRGIDGDGSIIWDTLAVDEWLHEHGRATRQLGLLMHLLGGSPSRGSEFVLLLLLNTQFRVRNVYWIDGRLILILFYGKCTSGSGHDRIVVHSVPWCVTKWFLVLYGVIRPFAYWVSRAAMMA
jgi:hypothetical protein